MDGGSGESAALKIGERVCRDWSKLAWRQRIIHNPAYTVESGDTVKRNIVLRAAGESIPQEEPG